MVADEVRFIANLCNRQSALMLSGDGQRCLVELEAFGVNAAEALRMAIFAGKEIEVTVRLVEDDRPKHTKRATF
jgi:hypothetical protein